METRSRLLRSTEIRKRKNNAEEGEKPKLDLLKQAEMERRKNNVEEVAEGSRKRQKIESQRPKTKTESIQANTALLEKYIAEGSRKRQKIESQRPKTKTESIQANTALLEKYRARYTTRVDFLEFDENGHTVWEISATVKGHQTKRTGTPYRSEVIPETGTLIGGNYNTRHDRKLKVGETKALHLSEILYCQIEEAKIQIRDKVSHLPELEGCEIPDFDLKKYSENSIVNKQTGKRISDFLGERTRQTYEADRDGGFDAFADAPTTESKLRLAHHYNKDCTSITIVKAKSDKFPGTEHNFSDRKPLPE